MDGLCEEGELLLLEQIACSWKEGGRTDWTKGFVWITSVSDDVYIQFSSRNSHQTPMLTIKLSKEYKSCNSQKAVLEINLIHDSRVNLRFQDEISMDVVKRSVTESVKKKEFNGVLGENIQKLNRNGSKLPIPVKKKYGVNLFLPIQRMMSAKDEVAEEGGFMMKSGNSLLLTNKERSNAEDDVENIPRLPSNQMKSSISRLLNQQTLKSRYFPRRSSFFGPRKNEEIVPVTPNGFPNSGTNCYASSMLQFLFSMPQFVRMIEEANKEEGRRVGGLMSELGSLLTWRNGEPDVTDDFTKLDKLKEMFNFHLENQEDAHHFLLALINHSEAIGPTESFKDYFKFELEETKTCLNCEGKTVTTETNNGIVLHVEQNGANASMQSHIDIKFKPLMEQFTCEHCLHNFKNVSCVIKKPPRLLILIILKPTERNFPVKLGDILVPHDDGEPQMNEQTDKVFESNIAKRQCPESDDPSIPRKKKREVSEYIQHNIISSTSSNNSIKDSLNSPELTALIDPQTDKIIDQELNEKENKDPSIQDGRLPSLSYKMVGCVSHLGTTCRSGHYVADCLQLVDRLHGRWLTFDDRRVEETSFEDVASLRGEIASFLIYMSENEFASCKSGSTV